MIATTERATARCGTPARALDAAAEKGWDNTETAYEFAAAVAATLAPVAAQHCAQDCIQVHGGIGFTWEHDTNVYYRRALGLVAAFGRSTEYQQKVFDTATTTGMRPVNIDLDPRPRKLRGEIRAEVEALKAIPREERKTAIAEGGWVQPHLPRPWVGRPARLSRSSSPRNSPPAGASAADGHRGVADPVDRRVRHRRPEAAVPAAHLPRRDDLVPAVLRSRGRIGSGQPDHQGHQGRRRLAHHRPEDLDHRRPVLPVGSPAGADGSERAETQRHHLFCST